MLIKELIKELTDFEENNVEQNPTELDTMLNRKFLELINGPDFSDIRYEMLNDYEQMKSYNIRRPGSTLNILTVLRSYLSDGGYRRRSSVKRYKSRRRHRAHTKSKHKKRRYSRYRK